MVEQVQSTGSVKPLTEVQVGTQVSGRMVKVHVDFNSKVKKGDLLAEIDHAVRRSGEPERRAAQGGRGQREARAGKAHDRQGGAQAPARAQGRGESPPPADVEQAQGEHDVADRVPGVERADVRIRAQLSGARTTLAYARIFSPIDGIVVNRAVDPGQTVAASFAAPVLFVIAQPRRCRCSPRSTRLTSAESASR